MYLPSYSPHLNLIARLWKFVQKECLHSKCYADFDSFRTAISSLIKTAHLDKYKELKSLMSWKFQPFKKVNFLGM
ncbi:MAG: transposase [Alkalinema sp. FL-bin-369]|nr:transposase [Leptolyngbyaceae cyanobacterium LF-bin-369]